MTNYPFHKYFHPQIECLMKYHQTIYLLVGKFFILGYLYVLLFENQVSLSYPPGKIFRRQGWTFSQQRIEFFTNGKYLQTDEILEDQFASRRMGMG